MENITTANTADALQAADLLDQAMILLTRLGKDVQDPEAAQTIKALWLKTGSAALQAETLANGMKDITGDGVREFTIAE